MMVFTSIEMVGVPNELFNRSQFYLRLANIVIQLTAHQKAISNSFYEYCERQRTTKIY